MKVPWAFYVSVQVEDTTSPMQLQNRREGGTSLSNMPKSEIAI
jgi:hypothetical protein